MSGDPNGAGDGPLESDAGGPAPGGLGGWILAAAFLAIAMRWTGRIDTGGALFLALLLLLLPRLAGAQRGDDPTALEMSRTAIYVQSSVMLGVLGALAAVLGVRRGGWRFLGLGPADPTVVLLWTAGLTAGALVLMALVHGIRLWTRDPEPPLVARLLPESPGEKLGFAGLSVMAGVGEEIAYRGYGWAALTLVTGAPLFSAVVTSAAFGWVHAYQGHLGMMRAGALGLMFSAPVLVAGTLWPAILAHTAVDWIGGLVLGRRLLAVDPAPAEA